jgi:hypothetical protein
MAEVTEADGLDARLMGFADALESAGAADDAEGMRSALAYVREAWRGADQEGLAEDVERFIVNAQAIGDLVEKHRGLGGVRKGDLG